MPIEKLLKELGINPVEVIIAKNSKIVKQKELEVEEDMRIKDIIDLLISRRFIESR